MKRALSYPAAEISDNVKSILARLYKVQHAKGKGRGEFVNDLSEAGLQISERQLDRWVARITSGDEAINPDKLTGALPSLGREDRDVTSGWVLEQLEHGEEVHLKSFSEFVLKHFKISICEQTALNYLNEDGFTMRVLKKKSSSFTVDLSILREDLWKWVSDRQDKFKDIPGSKLASLDFTFTGHRTERRSGFGIQGGAQPMESSKISKFTNCIVTCVWVDGMNRTPPILYTKNPAFRRDRNPTKRRDALVEHLDGCLALHGIDKDRVIYVGKEAGEKEVYTHESPDLLRRFFEYYGVGKDVTVLSDNGNSFFEEGESVLEALGFKKHECYPANVHQYISVNDNPLHGTSKRSWRTEGIDHSDDVNSSVALLKYLDRDIINNSKYWFKRNLLGLKEAEVADLIASAGSKKSHLHKGWLRAYRISTRQDARGERKNMPDELNDNLDGLYWGNPE